MKVRNSLSLIIVGILLIVGSGCNEKNYTVKTKVNSDGSIERTYIVEKDDSAAVYQNPFPVIFDSTWKIEVKKINDSTKNFAFTAKKYFRTSNYLMEDVFKSNSIDKLNNSVTIEKHFRWFYTYFDYRENYKEIMPFNNIPLEKFFSQSELKQFYADTVSKQLDAKLDEWWQKNIFEEYFKVLYNSAKYYNTPDFNTSLLNSKKDSLYKALIDSDTKVSGDIKAEKVIAICEKVLGTNKIRGLKNDFESIEKDINKNFESMLKLDGKYINEVILPGIIINTNSKEIEGNKLKWEFNPSYLIFKEMNAQSRMINTWAFVVTGVLVLFILTALILPLIRKKKSFLQ